MKPFLHERLRRSLLREMLDGKWSPGAVFHSNRAIRRIWEVNQRTVDRCMAQLVEEGVVEMQPRSGCRLGKEYREKALTMVQDESVPFLERKKGWNEKIEAVSIRPRKSRRWGVIFDSERLWHEEAWKPQGSILWHGSLFSFMLGAREAARRYCDEADVLLLPAERLNRRALERYMGQRRWDGVILCRRTMEEQAFHEAGEFFRGLGVPSLAVFEPVPVSGGLCLRVDDLGLGYQAAQQLVRAGVDQWVILSNMTLPVFHRDRVEGACCALRDAGVPAGAMEVCRMSFHSDDPFPPSLIERLRGARRERLGIFVLNNQLIKRLVPVFESLRLRFPQDVALITCGETLPIWDKPLSLMEICFPTIGARAIEMMHSISLGAEPFMEPLASSFRAGAST